MNLKEVSRILGIAESDLKHLIESGQLPARRAEAQMIVKDWEIDNGVVKAAAEAISNLCKYENYCEWVYETAERLGLTLQDLAKRTKLPIGTLVELGTTRGYLSASDQEIEDRIGKVLMRADIEKRCTDAGK